MSVNDLVEIAGYLSNPVRLTHIEVEIPQARLAKFAIVYQAASGHVFPGAADSSVYVIPTGGNKWGREMRIYFSVSDSANIPAALVAMITEAGRPGYDEYNSRVNNKDLVDDLFELGYKLGSPQDAALIRGNIDASLVSIFDSAAAKP